MKICVVGVGYVGLILLVVLVFFGYDMICIDKDFKKIEQLKNGDIFFYESGFLDVLYYCGNFLFFFEVKLSMEECFVIFIVVGIFLCLDGLVDMKVLQFVISDLSEVI